jgi:hypothetical protein
LYDIANSYAAKTQEYADAIMHHATRTSSQTLYPGIIYEDLALFLFKAPLPSKHIPKWFQTGQALALLFQLDPNACPRSDYLNFKPFENAPECVEVMRDHRTTDQPQVLFLRGHLSAEWIKTIGSFCRIDPEVFRWNLRFLNRQDYFSFPSLPSVSSNVVKLRFVTIGLRESMGSQSAQATVDILRAQGIEEMHRYQQYLMVNNGIKKGDSIVRDYFVIDDKHFCIEQEITVSFNKLGKTWTGRTDQSISSFR